MCDPFSLYAGADLDNLYESNLDSDEYSSLLSDTTFKSNFDNCIIQPQSQLEFPPIDSRAPDTPKTPSCPSQNGPFQLRSYVEEEKRVCEIGLRGDLSPSQCQFALQVLLYFLDIHQKLAECLSKPCDLKVAIDARAELCGAKFNQSTLQCTIPRKCKYIV